MMAYFLQRQGVTLLRHHKKNYSITYSNAVYVQKSTDASESHNSSSERKNEKSSQKVRFMNRSDNNNNTAVNWVSSRVKFILCI